MIFPASGLARGTTASSRAEIIKNSSDLPRLPLAAPSLGEVFVFQCLVRSQVVCNRSVAGGRARCSVVLVLVGELIGPVVVSRIKAHAAEVLRFRTCDDNRERASDGQGRRAHFPDISRERGCWILGFARQRQEGKNEYASQFENVR